MPLPIAPDASAKPASGTTFVLANGRDVAVTFILVCSLFLLWGFCNGMIDTWPQLPRAAASRAALSEMAYTPAQGQGAPPMFPRRGLPISRLPVPSNASSCFHASRSSTGSCGHVP